MDAVDWGEVNAPLSEDHYAALEADLTAHLSAQELYVRDAAAGADPRYRITVRVVSESPWHDLFARNMFRPLAEAERNGLRPGFTVCHAPSMEADPARHGTRSGAFVVLNFARRTVLIGGTAYAGEIKKSIFSVLNFLLPAQGVLPMHCSANIGKAGDAALFFGLSGTGKTTLSAAPDRRLVGDDEHGWSDRGVFNFEGGCYAKTIRLSAEGEPGIYAATRRFGTILENVLVDPETREIDYDSALLTENTRASYPIHFIPGAKPDGLGGHPANVIFLTADAFGVLPPVARLDPDQAMYHFLSGVHGQSGGHRTGRHGAQGDVQRLLRSAFPAAPPGRLRGAPGRQAEGPWRPGVAGEHGWTGGGHGTGARIELAQTRAMVAAVLDGALDDAAATPDPVFGLHVPSRVPGVPSRVLVPRDTWADGAAYDAAAGGAGRRLQAQLRAVCGPGVRGRAGRGACVMSKGSPVQRRLRFGRRGTVGAMAATTALTACESAEQFADRFRDLTPHEAYGASLAAAGLAETALARDWAAAGWQVLETPVPVALPFQEEGIITPETPAAAAYRLQLPRGRKLLVLATLESDEDARLFVDLFRLPANEGDPPDPSTPPKRSPAPPPTPSSTSPGAEATTCFACSPSCSEEGGTG